MGRAKTKVIDKASLRVLPVQADLGSYKEWSKGHAEGLENYRYFREAIYLSNNKKINSNQGDLLQYFNEIFKIVSPQEKEFLFESLPYIVNNFEDFNISSLKRLADFELTKIGCKRIGFDLGSDYGFSHFYNETLSTQEHESVLEMLDTVANQIVTSDIFQRLACLELELNTLVPQMNAAVTYIEKVVAKGDFRKLNSDDTFQAIEIKSPAINEFIFHLLSKKDSFGSDRENYRCLLPYLGIDAIKEKLENA